MIGATISSHSSAFILPVSIVMLALFGCSESGQSNSDDSGTTSNNCTPGLKPMGPACVPIFDECQDDEVPMLGGGCKRVGVKECLDGWGLAGPPDWTCKPIGPPRTCLKGWEKVAGGWCEPILPKTKCPVGTMEKIGFSTCQDIGDCGTGTWGKISAATIYVDQGHAGTGGKGTKAEPYKTIGEALKQAIAGDHIAVAAGTYIEQVVIQRKVTLEGRCAEMVTIKVGIPQPAVEIKDWANGAVLRNMTITGIGMGMLISGVDVIVERVAVQGCNGWGVFVFSGGTLTLYDSLVAGNRTVGIMIESSKATIERSVVRETRERTSDMQGGLGIQALHEIGKNQGSELMLRDSLVAGNRYVGIFIASSKATVERSVVRDTQEQASDKQFGVGIRAHVETNRSEGSELVLRDSLVTGNRYVGISVASSKATVERSVVRDTREEAMDMTNGWGIQAHIGSGQTLPSELTLSDSLVAGNRTIGIVVGSSKMTLERTIVQDTREQASDNEGGIGIQAGVESGYSKPSELTVRDSVVARNRTAGIVVANSKMTLERTIVRDTREQASDNEGGIGIQAGAISSYSQPSRLTLRDSLVVRNRTMGVVFLSSIAVFERSVVRDTREQVSDGSFGFGIQASIQYGHTLSSELTVRDSLVAGNQNIGIVLFSSKASIERTVVRDTQGKESSSKFGIGIQAWGQFGKNLPSELTVRDSLVAKNRNVGIIVVGSRGKISRCVVSDTRKDGLGEYGDGIVAGDTSTLDVEEVLIERSARAGVLFSDAGRSVNRSLIRGNVFAIDLEQGAAPFIGDDNLMVDNQINNVTIGRGLKRPSIPSVPYLGGSEAGMDAGPDAGVSAQ